LEIVEERRSFVLEIFPIETSCKSDFLDSYWRVSESVIEGLLRYCCGEELWRFVESLEIFVVLFSAFAEDFEVIVIVNKTSFMVELDDCYCCAG